MLLRVSLAVVLVLALLACKRSRPAKNDDIAACNASGGRWVEGGCSDSGRCEKSNGMAPDEVAPDEDDADDGFVDDDRDGQDD